MTELGRINLLVGKNNSGKTSLIEAIQLLEAGADLTALWRICNRRGEQPTIENVPGMTIQMQADLSHLFYGHEIEVGKEMSISSSDARGVIRRVDYQVEKLTPENTLPFFNQITRDEPVGSTVGLRVSGLPQFVLPTIPLTNRSSLRNDVFSQLAPYMQQSKWAASTAQYITSDSFTIADMINTWNNIVLTPDEDRAIEALRLLDPSIERVASLGMPIFQLGGNSRGGLAVRQRGSEQRIPIGSFGDGMWRILALAIALSKAKGSVLMVDEIDTGLHYSVMAKMWHLINNASKTLGIQVFATTHSFDCVHSLATVCKSEGTAANEITIQRIEAGSSRAVAFNEQEIKIAADRNIEIR